MKISAVAFLAALPITCMAGQILDAHEVTHCVGVDWYSCSPGELNYFGHTLETTFNQLHQGRYLFDTHWIGVENGAFSEATVDSRGRRLQGGAGRGGSYGCDLCGYDDAFEMDADMLEDSHNAWAKALSEELKNSGFTCFENVKQCAVSLDERPKKSNTVSAAVHNIKKESTSVQVACDGVSFATLSKIEQTFAAHKLEVAFNNAATSMHLADIEFVSGAPQVAGALTSLLLLGGTSGNGAGFFRGQVASKHVVADDISKNLRAADAAQANLMAAWQLQLEQLLRKAPFSALSHAANCKIQMMLD